MSQVYIGDLCHVLPDRVMNEFQNGFYRPWFGDGEVCHQYLYSEMSQKDWDEYQDWYESLTDDEQDDLDSTVSRQNCDNEDDLGYYPGEYKDGDKVDSESEYMFSMCETWGGDGLFYDQDGNSYGVDMGCMGVVYIEDEIKDICKERAEQGLGQVFDISEFDIEFGDPPIWCGIPRLVRDGEGTFIFGGDTGRQVIIMTGPADEEVDEDE